MGKELTPLEAYKELISFILDIQCGTTNSEAMRFTDSFTYLEQNVFPIVEKALKRLDELDSWINQSNTTKIKALNNKLKALEIIKEKRVDTGLLRYSQTVEEYNRHYAGILNLTQEEFDFLKRELK